jgi:hypothetical protein
MWPSIIASRRSGAYKIVPRSASNGNADSGADSALAVGATGGSDRATAVRVVTRDGAGVITVGSGGSTDGRSAIGRVACGAGSAERGTIGGGWSGGLRSTIDDGGAVAIGLVEIGGGGAGTIGFVATDGGG